MLCGDIIPAPLRHGLSIWKTLADQESRRIN